MDDYKQIIENAKPGEIIPIVKRIEMADPMDFFAKISDYGRAKNCCLLESREYLAGSQRIELRHGQARVIPDGQRKRIRNQGTEQNRQEND